MEIPYTIDDSKKKASLDMQSITDAVKEQSKREKEKQKHQKNVHIKYGDLQNPYLYNMTGFIERFSHIDTLGDSELERLVHENYISILDAINLMSPEQSQVSNPYYVSLVGLFTNQKFVSSLANILRNAPLDNTRRYYLNRIIYNYLVLPNEQKDSTIERLLVDLSNTINAQILPTLIGIGLPMDIASYVAIAANSSFNDHINVRRVNLIIFNCGNLEVMTLQRIVDIYQYMFNRSVTVLFEAIMFDVYSEDDLKNATSSQREIYSLMVTAVLELLNNMPSNAIRTILTSYSADYAANPRPVRCSLCLSNDYYRINEVIDMMERVDRIYLP